MIEINVEGGHINPLLVLLAIRVFAFFLLAFTTFIDTCSFFCSYSVYRVQYMRVCRLH